MNQAMVPTDVALYSSGLTCSSKDCTCLLQHDWHWHLRVGCRWGRETPTCRETKRASLMNKRWKCLKTELSNFHSFRCPTSTSWAGAFLSLGASPFVAVKHWKTVLSLEISYQWSDMTDFPLMLCMMIVKQSASSCHHEFVPLVRATCPCPSPCLYLCLFHLCLCPRRLIACFVAFYVRTAHPHTNTQTVHIELFNGIFGVKTHKFSCWKHAVTKYHWLCPYKGRVALSKWRSRNPTLVATSITNDTKWLVVEPPTIGW